MPGEQQNSSGGQQLSIPSESTEGNREGTAYQRLLHAVHSDARWLTDVNLGKRVGFYRFRGDLGSGNFSQVKMAVHQLTREAVAIKILDKAKLDAKTRKMLAREISTMEAIHHPNIIRLYEVVETYSKIHLVLEYASGGELFNRITTSGKLTEDEAKQLFGQVVSAVIYMHDHGFIHRDIKAENVFYSGPGLVKLGDFGFSTQLTTGMNEQLKTFCGSPPYAAPELFRDDSYLGAPVDIWALGVLLYFLTTAQMPFKALTVAALKQHILQGIFAPPAVSAQCAQLIESILRQPPRERLSLADICRSDWLCNTHIPPQPGPCENYILTPSLLPRKGSVVTINGREKATASDGDEKVASNGDAAEAVEIVDAASELAAEYRSFGLTDIEIAAREKLATLGVGAELLDEHASHGAKSAVVGAYRMMVHRIQKSHSSLEQDNTVLEEASLSGQACPSGNNNVGRRKSKSACYKTKSGTKVLQRNRSKTCVII